MTIPLETSTLPISPDRGRWSSPLAAQGTQRWRRNTCFARNLLACDRLHSSRDKNRILLHWIIVTYNSKWRSSERVGFVKHSPPVNGDSCILHLGWLQDQKTRYLTYHGIGNRNLLLTFISCSVLMRLLQSCEQASHPGLNRGCTSKVMLIPTRCLTEGQKCDGSVPKNNCDRGKE